MADLLTIARDLSESGDEGALPVDDWHPERCGEMDLVIEADGTWVHEGAPIRRAALVRLFSRVLRRDGDEYALVTPAERIAIAVRDAPFLVVDTDRDGDDLIARTNVGDAVTVGPNHPIEMRTSPALGLPLPYLRVRGGLDARFDRAAYYRLVEDAAREDGALVVRSGGARFVLGAAEEESGQTPDRKPGRHA